MQKTKELLRNEEVKLHAYKIELDNLSRNLRTISIDSGYQSSRYNSYRNSSDKIMGQCSSGYAIRDNGSDAKTKINDSITISESLIRNYEGRIARNQLDLISERHKVSRLRNK